MLPDLAMAYSLARVLHVGLWTCLLGGRIWTWLAVSSGLVIDFAIIRGITNLSLKKGAGADLVMNGVSGFLAFFYYFFIVALCDAVSRTIFDRFDGATFLTGEWVVTVLMAVTFDTITKLCVLRWGFNQAVFTTKKFGLLFAGTSISTSLIFESVYHSPAFY